MVEIFTNLTGTPPEGWEFVPYVFGSVVALYFLIAINNVIFSIFVKRKG